MIAGWTVFKPSADGRKVYVSSSGGDDARDGSTYLKAVRSLARGKSLMRHGFPDHFLAKRGDVWDESLGHWTKSGRSTAEPMVIGTYGTAVERPLIRTGTDEGMFTQYGGESSDQIDHLAVTGLHFVGSGDNGLRFLVPGLDVLVEDCRVEGYRVNVLFQGVDGKLQSYRLRRSVIVDSDGSTKAHSQGLYAYAVDGLLLEQNLFDRCGHPADIYSHAAYIDNGNTGVEVRGNIFSRPGSHGIQMRSGGVAFNNLFVRCPIALLLGGGNAPEPGGIEFDARGNCVVEGANIDAENPRGWGILAQNVRSGYCAGNLIAHSSVGAQPAALILDGTHKGEDGALDHGVHDIGFEGNLIHDWPEVQVQGNVSGIVGLPAHSVGPFRAPARSVASYNGSIGGAQGFDAFMERARGQSRKAWDSRLLARAVNAYLRAGFGMPG